MKKILISLIIIGVVAVIAVGGTFAYFRDTEVSAGNTFAAGSIDLKIDLSCEDGCGFPLKDLNGEHFFSECDVKPGDSEEVTISWHVYDNDAWGRLMVTDVHSWEYGCTEPEEDVDATCDSPGDGQGELEQYLNFTVWLDEGSTAGWQCPENEPECTEDPQEGDNSWNGVEETIIVDMPLSELMDEWIVFPEILEGSKTYYLGVEWEIPSSAGNVMQSDSLMGKIVMQVVQSRNNEWPPSF